MKRLKFAIVSIFLLSLSTIGLNAQQSCYQIGLNEGKEIFNAAQRLEKSGKGVDAVPQYWEALRRFRLTRSCRDLPANHELDTWEDKSIKGITDGGGKINETTYLNASPRSLRFTENGGNLLITVNTNVNTWRVGNTPAWCTTRKSNNQLTVTCSKNTASTGRSEKLTIIANALTYEITIEQAGKTQVEISPSASVKITGLQFAGRYADGTSGNFGEKLYNNMTFLRPQITCNYLTKESKKIKLEYKILDPNGKLLSGPEYTYSEEINLRANLQQNDVLELSEWGVINGTAFAVTGKYTFEIWSSGVNMYSTAFEVLAKPLPPCEGIKITRVRFAGKLADGTSKGHGESLYNNMTFLLPRITLTNLTEDSKVFRLNFRILDPAGNLIAPITGNSWDKEMTINGNIQQVYEFDIPEWGSATGTSFEKAGIYQFEIWCSGKSIYTTSFEVMAPESQVQPQPKPKPSASSSGLKASVGIKAGLNLVNVSDETWADMRPDFHAGILFNLNFGHKGDKPGFFSLQPEVLYSRQGFKMDGEAINFDYITIPLMFKFYVYQGLNLEVGPWGAFLISVNPDSKAIDGMNIKLSDLKGGKDIGIAAGIGYDFNFGLILGARYQHGLSDMAGNLLWRNRVISISAGWKF
ncbi:MAG: outer membrane beta-barrel protein [Bacteroidales bacterium]|jgi:hypothetical protein|nr:outer membrane beta-barrel protein [Bacteroidales bacterium]